MNVSDCLIKQESHDYLGMPSKKQTSYSVTLSLKVGGGQDEIILLGAAKIVTRWLRWGGLRSLCHHFLGYFWQYFDGQNGIKS